MMCDIYVQLWEIRTRNNNYSLYPHLFLCIFHTNQLCRIRFILLMANQDNSFIKSLNFSWIWWFLQVFLDYKILNFNIWYFPNYFRIKVALHRTDYWQWTNNQCCVGAPLLWIMDPIIIGPISILYLDIDLYRYLNL